MEFLNRLLRGPASVELLRRDNRALLCFRYNRGLTTFARVLKRWPELSPLSPWVELPGQLVNIVPEDRLGAALAAIDALAAERAGEARLRFEVSDALRAPAAAEPAPERAAAAPALQARRNTEAFFRDARALLERAEEGAAPVPIGATGPSYASLSPEQLRWYLCLRTALRRGEAPDTPFPYLLLHMYELVNRLGVRDDRQGLDALTALWRNYRARCPQLAGAPARWIWDYVQVYGVDVPPAELLAALPGFSEQPADAALTALEASGAPLRLPVWLLSRLSGYDLGGSRLFQVYGDRVQLEEWVTGAVAAVDAALRAHEGKGILAGRCMSRPHTEQVVAFAGAPVLKERTYALRTRRFHGSPRLAAWLTTVLRYTENGLRARCHVAGRLKNAEPELPVREAVDAYLAQAFDRRPAPAAPKPAPRLSLNMGDVAKLRAESDAVREALLAGVAQDAPEEEAAPPAREPAPVSGGDEAAAWDAFLARADREALAALLEGTDALRALARGRGRMPDALLDELNEAAADTLGDLIAGESGVYEEYEAQLRERLAAE